MSTNSRRRANPGSGGSTTLKIHREGLREETGWQELGSELRS